MKYNGIEITDELLACYVENTVSDEERAAVEAYLSENAEALDELFLIKGETAFQESQSHASVFGQSMVGHNAYAIAASSNEMNCAIRAQQMVLRNYGVEVSLEELTELAKQRGWFEEGAGTAFDYVGELLNTYGVESVQMRNAGVYHIMHELSQGHKIIVGVDSPDDRPEQHVILVAGIDTTDPNNLQVIVSDPAHPGQEQRYSANEFMQHWKQTGCFMVATKQAAPLSSNPEMQHFDYELGYVRKFADLAYEEIVKRLADEGYIADPSAKGSGRHKTRFYLVGIIVLLLLGALGYYLWRVSTPLQMKVNVIDDATCFIPSLPFENGTLTCEYAGNAQQTIQVSADNRTVFLNEIPYHSRKEKVHLHFEADGYESIDTLVPVQKALNLTIKRNNDLGVVFGRVVDYKTEQPIENATVSLQDITSQTDAFGQFRLEIPFAKQAKTQRLQVTKEGYQVWEGLYRPSPTEPWYVPMVQL